MIYKNVHSTSFYDGQTPLFPPHEVCEISIIIRHQDAATFPTPTKMATILKVELPNIFFMLVHHDVALKSWWVTNPVWWQVLKSVALTQCQACQTSTVGPYVGEFPLYKPPSTSLRFYQHIYAILLAGAGKIIIMSTWIWSSFNFAWELPFKSTTIHLLPLDSLEKKHHHK